MAQCLAILAPSGRDANVIHDILNSADVETCIEHSMGDVLSTIADGRAGAAILAEEALSPQLLNQVEAWLRNQPPWSDLPIILLTRGRAGPATNIALAAQLGNVTILERPLHPVTLVSAARSALRARARQHEAERYVEDLKESQRRLSESEAKLEKRVEEAVAEQMRDQQKLAEANERMHEMAKLETLGQLTGGVAHDFNNLLTPIVGALDMLRRQHVDNDRSSRLIGGALQASQRAATLVQRLLSFARRQHLEARVIGVGELVEGMHDLVQRTIGPHIRVEVDIAPDLPPARIDPGQLELAILNLAVNARDAMPGGGSLRLVVDTVVGGEAEGLKPAPYVRVAVRDSGVGMDSATLHRAIEPFFTTKGQGEGTGLGLSMVHGLAAQSGGALRIDSKVGEGTSAEIWLPAAAGEADHLARSDDRLPVQPRHASILVVDDEPLVRLATSEMLREMGHRVVEAESGPEALAILRSDAEFDLLITDYLMPTMRGSELAAEAQRLRGDLPVLLLTGYANLAKGEAAGISRLAKPFREADLARQVAELLSTQTPAERRKRIRSVE